MTAPQIVVLGFSPSGKTPGAFFNRRAGVGRVDPSSFPRKVLIVGNMTTGTATPDADIIPITSATDLTATFGARSEIGRMLSVAEEYPGLALYAAPIAEASSGAKATASITFVGAATGSGTHLFYVDGEPVFVNVASGDSATAQATAAAAAFNLVLDLPCVATASTGTVTLTAANFGIRGNDHTLYYDPQTGPAPAGTKVQIASAPATTILVASNGAALPQATINIASNTGFPTAGNAVVYTDQGPQVVAYTGTTSTTLTGCTGGLGTMSTGGVVYPQLYAVNPGSGGVFGCRFGGGTGTDDCTNVLALLQGDTYFTIATAQNDATNAGRWKAYDVAKGAIGTQKYEHITLGFNGLYTTAKSVSQTTINHQRFCVAWVQGCESHPSQIAASMACLRTQYEQIHPNQKVVGQLLGIAPQRSKLDIATPSDSGTQNIALQNGVTPGVTQTDGTVTILRPVTALSTRGGSPFYGCIDLGQARAPDSFAEEVKFAWDTEFGVVNQWVNDDPSPGQPTRPAGVATPAVWNGYVNNLAAAKIAINWFDEVSTASQFDAVNGNLVTQINTHVTPLNWRIGGNIDQTT